MTQERYLHVTDDVIVRACCKKKKITVEKYPNHKSVMIKLWTAHPSKLSFLSCVFSQREKKSCMLVNMPTEIRSTLTVLHSSLILHPRGKLDF